MQALALSWLPAVDEPSKDHSREEQTESYTYHHLRRDLFTLASRTGVNVASRYVIPSAHLTIGRFIDKSDFEKSPGLVDQDRVAQLVAKIDEINAMLQHKFWPRAGGDVEAGSEYFFRHLTETEPTAVARLAKNSLRQIRTFRDTC